MSGIVDLSGKKISVEIIEINGFKFNKEFWSSNPAFGLTLAMAADPTPLMAEVLEKLEITILDDEGKQFFPKVKKEVDNNLK